MTGDLHVREWGSGPVTLVLLHGLGATGAVWRRTATALEGRWQGAIAAPDLPGHGRSRANAPYSFASMAGAIASWLPPSWDGVVVGHSLGGVLAFTLATGEAGPRPRAPAGIGIKVAWTDEELARAGALAERPVAAFPTRGEADARFRRVAGLDGIEGLEPADLDGGVRPEGDGYRLAQDPGTFAVGAPDMRALMTAVRGRGVLARGATDAMVTDEQLRELDPSALTITGAGHNAHVEAPERVADLIVSLAR